MIFSKIKLIKYVFSNEIKKYSKYKILWVPFCFCDLQFPPCESIESPCDCYIIDQNGYIIHSPREDEIGKFFGTVDGGAAAMGQMVKDKIFREISMFDYQAIDDEKNDPVNSASSSIFNVHFTVYWNKI